MSRLARVWITFKALAQIGPQRTLENAWYRLGLKLGWWQIPVPQVESRWQVLNLEGLPPLPEARPVPPALLQEARQIVDGQVRLFGAEPVPLRLAPPGELHPWVDYNTGRAGWGAEDVKFIWEPARFGWALALARAYLAVRDETFPNAFWNYFEQFEAANPAYLGPNWASGQEAALRIVIWGAVLKSLAASPASTPERMQRLAASVAAHAARIPPTLIYARSQDNNHLLSEATGLYTAGILLPEHPSARGWRKEGWAWFNRAVQRQVTPDGAYIQQSVNYHRLFLHLALWVDALARRSGERWPEETRQRLAAATAWLAARVDPLSGQAPNFGHNDGANLFAFGEYADQRPTLRAASRAFSGAELLTPGPGDELDHWLGLAPADSSGAAEDLPVTRPAAEKDSTGAILRAENSWAVLRAGAITHRPGQADQLQVDLWSHGRALTLDPGTYRYNAAAPWDNALAGAEVHNTVSVDGSEPMTRAGRFLWLDWDQGEVLTCIPGRAVARREGYRRLGVWHKRTLEILEGERWKVSDELLPVEPRTQAHDFVLHWLLPDGEWQVEGQSLLLQLPTGACQVDLEVQGVTPSFIGMQVVRAGEVVWGAGEAPLTLGWYSPTYGVRLAALSLRLRIRALAPVRFKSTFEIHALDISSGSR